MNKLLIALLIGFVSVSLKAGQWADDLNQLAVNLDKHFKSQRTNEHPNTVVGWARDRFSRNIPQPLIAHNTFDRSLYNNPGRQDLSDDKLFEQGAENLVWFWDLDGKGVTIYAGLGGNKFHEDTGSNMRRPFGVLRIDHAYLQQRRYDVGWDYRAYWPRHQVRIESTGWKNDLYYYRFDYWKDPYESTKEVPGWEDILPADGIFHQHFAKSPYSILDELRLGFGYYDEIAPSERQQDRAKDEVTFLIPLGQVYKVWTERKIVDGIREQITIGGVPQIKGAFGYFMQHESRQRSNLTNYSTKTYQLGTPIRFENLKELSKILGSHADTVLKPLTKQYEYTFTLGPYKVVSETKIKVKLIYDDPDATIPAEFDVAGIDPPVNSDPLPYAWESIP